MHTRILLVEDHEIVRQGIKALLDGHQQVSVAGEASNGAEAMDRIDGDKPDLILMDMHMPVMNGLECTRLIKQKYPAIKILILSMHDHENYLIDMIEAGADGYILKSTTKEELLFAIRKIANNGKYIGSEFTIRMLLKIKNGNGSKSSIQQITFELTEREKEVLFLIADGHTNAEIATKLFTSIRTIETRRKRLLEKTNTSNTATLIRFAVNVGLVN